MSNSSLVKYTKLSPNHSGKRTHSIDRITPHCAVGQLSVESLGNIFQKTGDNAVSCNYAIGTDGRVALIVDEGQRSWCSSSKSNDQRAVTIECASDKTSPYAFNDTVYNQLIELCVDICKRNGKTKLLWISDKDKALAYEPKSGEMLLTVHRWFANKSCPGDWLMQRMGDLASKVTAKLSESGSAPATATAPAASSAADTTPKYYRVRKSWKDADSQLGAYSIYEKAKIKADEAGPRYAVFDWNGKEIYRAAVSTEKEIRFFYPGYSFSGSDPDDRRGGGCIFHDQDGKVLIYDAYMKNSDPACKMIEYLKDKGLTEVDTAVLSHAHVDHGGGFFKMLEAGIKIKNFLCYDPASLKLAGTGSGNAKGVLEDKEYLQGLISYMKRMGAAVRYIDEGDTVICGEMTFDVYRDQPDHFTSDDGGHGWAYTNDGSLCLYEPDLCVLLIGDADGSHAADLCGTIYIVEAGHHGNNGTESKAKKFKSKGCRLAIECNNEKDGPGSCDFTRYCARRLIEAGIEVWQLNGDITGRAVKGKMFVKQGGKSRSFDVSFGRAAKAPVTEDVAEEPLTEQEIFISKIGALAKTDMARNGICAAITIAQAILESGWGKSELARNANNLFGMKKSLSGNRWSGSTWDGKSVYSKQTKEVYASGPATVHADFRAYRSWEESVGDHSAYLIGAKNGTAYRYKGLVGCTDYKKAAQIIKDGGYATAPDYVSKLCRLVEQYDLTRWNTDPSASDSSGSAPAAKQTGENDGLFRVRKNWSDGQSQVGAYRNPRNGIAKVKEAGTDYELYDDQGVPVYPDSYSGWFRVRKSWEDTKSQISAHKYIEWALDMADSHPGYYVFDDSGRKIYPV